MFGVKGRIQTRVIENNDGSRKKKTEIIAERVTFLAQSDNNKNQSNNYQSKKDNNRQNKDENSKKTD